MTLAEQRHVGVVVEGSGEIEAVPLLLRSWLHSRGDYRNILGKPLTCHGPRLTAKMDIEKAVSRSPSLKRLLERFATLVEAVG